MTTTQENAVYRFLENTVTPFTVDDIVAHIRKLGFQRPGSLILEINALLTNQKIAFNLDMRKWISRRGYFESACFVIKPTKLELLNGILIPGHRCIPFANPLLFPHDYVFYWKGKPIDSLNIEGSPDEFYPYYSLFGEEYAPQYIARDNPENESAFSSDFYEDPLQVSLKVTDMRSIYRESLFVPGDYFIVKTRDWKKGLFDLTRLSGSAWTQQDLQAWLVAAEIGFERAFETIGAGDSTEEQIAFAYWYGRERMRTIPAYSLEEFIYEKTARIETVSYGIETRFWYAGKEIPDQVEIENKEMPDRDLIEDVLYRNNIPISRFVVQSYMRDAFFRRDSDMLRLIERIVPASVGMCEHDREIFTLYLMEMYHELVQIYSLFLDYKMGPVRQRIGELHTAVIDLTARLRKNELDASRLPKHTFIILSQIQEHAASSLEDLDTDELLSDADLTLIDNSLESMLETYEDMKNLIDEYIDSFRRGNLALVRSKKNIVDYAQVLQLSIGGTEIWRRLQIPMHYQLRDLHASIQKCFNWNNTYPYRFITPSHKEAIFNPKLTIEEINTQKIGELSYEYGNRWTVQIILFSRIEAENEHTPQCTAGSGAPPPDHIDGPVQFRRLVAALHTGTVEERQAALRDLGSGFNTEQFDIELCNHNLRGQL
ncbi:MAG: plasmid pRiA4b ORF-3 family protein [Spirochaetaceae bacterium]|jgi:hypothetical protein|nr:plasmid pRiA4b ORF-3 family protein [Spirochaetaceae bacterium]